MPGPQCRYAVGSILSEGENKADEELLKSYETSGFNVFSFPEVTHVVTTSFPHRTFFSILLGIRRVYPRLEQYIKVLCLFDSFLLHEHTVYITIAHAWTDVLYASVWTSPGVYVKSVLILL